MATLMANPYAASILSDLRKYKTVATQPIHKNIFMLGIKSWPFINVGNFIVTRGQKFKLTASLISVKEPLIKAWLAITAAAVAIIIPGNKNQCGIISKKGFNP